MDKDHRLDAPHNNSLKDIEQLSDRSDVSAVYHAAHKEWEGKDLISDEERHARSAKELLDSVLAIRGKFLLIGLFLPLPFILLALLMTVLRSNIATQDSPYYIGVLILAGGAWIGITYAISRRILKTFYAHGLRGVPFIIVLALLIAPATLLVYRTIETMLPTLVYGQIALMGIVVICLSIPLTGLILWLWTTPKIPALYKILVMTLSIIGLVGLSLFPALT